MGRRGRPGGAASPSRHPAVRGCQRGLHPGGSGAPETARRLRPPDDRAAARARRPPGSRRAAPGIDDSHLPRREHRLGPRGAAGPGSRMLRHRQPEGGPGRRLLAGPRDPRPVPVARRAGVVRRHAGVGDRARAQHRAGEPAGLHAAGRHLGQPPLLRPRHHRAGGGGERGRDRGGAARGRPGVRDRSGLRGRKDRDRRAIHAARGRRFRCREILPGPRERATAPAGVLVEGPACRHAPRSNSDWPRRNRA